MWVFPISWCHWLTCFPQDNKEDLFLLIHLHLNFKIYFLWMDNIPKRCRMLWDWEGICLGESLALFFLKNLVWLWILSFFCQDQTILFPTFAMIMHDKTWKQTLSEETTWVFCPLGFLVLGNFVWSMANLSGLVHGLAAAVARGGDGFARTLLTETELPALACCLCGWVANRPQTGSGLEIRVWALLF